LDPSKSKSGLGYWHAMPTQYERLRRGCPTLERASTPTSCRNADLSMRRQRFSWLCGGNFGFLTRTTWLMKAGVMSRSGG
jgi:hypothetical protein